MKCSDCTIVNHGLPQLTVLGTLLLFSYVNDFSSTMNTMERVIQFSDNTSIVCCGKESRLHGKVKEIFQKKTGICRDEQANFECNKNRINLFLAQ